MIAQHGFKLTGGQNLGETTESGSGHLPAATLLKTILWKLNNLYELCLRIEDEEDAIDYLTVALRDIIQKVESKVPQSLVTGNLLNMETPKRNAAISFRSIIARLYNILEDCRTLEDMDDITEAISVIIHQVKAYNPRSTMFLLG